MYKRKEYYSKRAEELHVRRRDRNGGYIGHTSLRNVRYGRRILVGVDTTFVTRHALTIEPTLREALPNDFSLPPIALKRVSNFMKRQRVHQTALARFCHEQIIQALNAAENSDLTRRREQAVPTSYQKRMVQHREKPTRRMSDAKAERLAKSIAREVEKVSGPISQDIDAIIEKSKAANKALSEYLSTQ